MTKNLPAVSPLRQPQVIQGFTKRCENVLALVDPMDRLLQMRKLSLELYGEKLREERIGEKGRLTSGGRQGLWMTGSLGGSFALMMAGTTLPLLGGILMLAAGIGWLAGGIVMSTSSDERALARHRKKYADLPMLEEMERRVDAELDKALAAVDPRAVALSPQATEVFDSFPSLKEKFLLAQSIDKVRTEEAALKQIPHLEKAKPEL